MMMTNWAIPEIYSIKVYTKSQICEYTVKAYNATSAKNNAIMAFGKMSGEPITKVQAFKLNMKAF